MPSFTELVDVCYQLGLPLHVVVQIWKMSELEKDCCFALLKEVTITPDKTEAALKRLFPNIFKSDERLFRGSAPTTEPASGRTGLAFPHRGPNCSIIGLYALFRLGVDRVR